MPVFLKALCGDVATCIWTATGQAMPPASTTMPVPPLLTQVGPPFPLDQLLVSCRVVSDLYNCHWNGT